MGRFSISVFPRGTKRVHIGAVELHFESDCFLLQTDIEGISGEHRFVLVQGEDPQVHRVHSEIHRVHPDHQLEGCFGEASGDGAHQGGAYFPADAQH